MIKLEHANISAADAEATTRFITSAFPEFHVRGEGLDGLGIRRVHTADVSQRNDDTDSSK